MGLPVMINETWYKLDKKLLLPPETAQIRLEHTFDDRNR
jgi:hypothetical protein